MKAIEKDCAMYDAGHKRVSDDYSCENYCALLIIDAVFPVVSTNLLKDGAYDNTEVFLCSL